MAAVQAEDDLLAGRRIVVAGAGERAEKVAEGLRARKAKVAVAPATAEGLEPARLFDPEVVIACGAALEDWTGALRRDPRLRWASVVEADLDADGVTDVDALAMRISALVAQDRRLTQR